MVDSATELGRIIGGLANSQSAIKENLSPDDVNAQLNVVNSESFVIEGKLTVKSRILSNVLTVNHAVYGVVGTASGYRVYIPLILGHPTWGLLGSGYLSSSVSYLVSTLFEKEF